MAAALFTAVAQAQFVVPTENLVADGLPPIPSELAEKVSAFGDYPSASLVTWRPASGGMLIRARDRGTSQIFVLSQPGARPEPLTDFADDVAGATIQPGNGEYIVFQKGRNGDDVFQLFQMKLASGAWTAISDAKDRAGAPSWNRKGDRIVYSSSTIDRNSSDGEADRTAVMKVVLVDPLAPAAARTIATFKGRRFSAFRFSPDDKSLMMRESISASESHLWLLDLESGAQRRLTQEQAREPVYYAGAEFSQDGKRVYAISDRDHEFRRLVAIDVATGKEEALAPRLKFDVSEFAVSEKAKRIALLTNEEGSSVLRLLELDGFKELPRPPLFPGEISGLRWNVNGMNDEGDGKKLAFNLVAARSPGAVFSLNIESGRLTRWTNSPVRGASPVDFVEPRVVKWKSFDGLTISGLVYQPDPQKFPGKRPVIINIHGGPEGQARAGFLGRGNYLVNELGLALIFPNVRGSTGFGKTFLTLDNGKKREDPVKDIGALLDWIKEKPELDAGRVLVMGSGYGGYMSFAVSTHYADRIAGAIDVVGISNFVTFLTHTEGDRRDLRRAEYGDERDPDMRAFLEKISPLNNARKITKPLFVVQGRNDPCVPYTEAEQIVAQLKKQNTPVWFLMARDEGHGFTKKNNVDFLFYAQVKFLEQNLLK